MRFSDLDVLGHVNNAKYLTFFEQSRIEWFRDVTGMAADSVDWDVILAHIEIDFLEPAKLGDEITVHTRCAKIGKKSITLESVMYAARKGEVFPTAWYKAILVYFDYEKEETIFVPDTFRNSINKYQNTYL